MTENIPALVAEAKKLLADFEYGNRHDRTRMIESFVTVLESLSAPSGDDLEALDLIGNATEDQKQETILSVIFQRHYIQPIPGNVDDFSECVCGGWSEGAMEPGWDDHMAEVAIAAGFRRPSPVTREALEDAIGEAPTAGTLSAKDVVIVAAEILSRFAFKQPEPAEVLWEYAEFSANDLRPDGTIYDSIEPRDIWDIPLPADELAELRAEGGVYARRAKPKLSEWVPVKGAEQ